MEIGSNLSWAIVRLALTDATGKLLVHKRRQRDWRVAINEKRNICSAPRRHGGRQLTVFVGKRWIQRTFPVEFAQGILTDQPVEITLAQAYSITGVTK